MSQTNAASLKRKLLADFNAVVHEADQLLNAINDEGSDTAVAFRGKVERNLNAAKERLRDLEDAVVEKTRAGARATDEYVHENPWQTIGAAAGLSVIFGVALGVLLYRR